MKPVKLTIDGIKSFLEPQTVDFELLGKSNIFVISGVTGAGKSTVLDCIILALYGNKSDKLKIEEYINLKRDRAGIELEFETEERGKTRRYKVTRTFFRDKNKGSRASLIDAETGIALCEGTDKVNAETERILGLPVDSFTKVIVLEQGKYSEFLKAKHSERTKLVAGLFGLEKYRDLYSKASAAKKEADAAKTALDEWLNARKELTAAALSERKKSISACKKRSEEIEKLLENENKKRDGFNKARAAYEAYEKAVKALTQAEEQAKKAAQALDVYMKKCGDTNALEEKRSEAIGRAAAATQARISVEALADTAKQLVETQKELGKRIEEYRKENAALGTVKRTVSDESAALTALNEKVDALVKKAERLGCVFGGDNLTAADMQKRIGELRLNDAAASLAEELSVGDICPVCGGSVGEKKALRNPESKQVESILSELAVILEKRVEKEKAYSDALAKQAVSQSKLDGLQNEGKTLRDAETVLKSRLSAELGEDSYETALKKKTEQEKELLAKKAEIEKELKEHDSEIKRLQAAKSEAVGKFDSLVETAKKLKCASPDEEGEQKNKEAIELLEAEKQEVFEKSGTLSADLMRDEKELEIKRGKESEKKALSARTDDLKMLMSLFKGDKFLEFITEEYIADFTVDASDTLARMSGGSYTMVYDEDGEFSVCDFKAGNKKRNVRTLSGGETFLASLSLAIAVSRSIAEKNTGGLKFDFLFLDEGFGTLHKDAIGVVERALRLLSKETLVGIVTHRSELSELIPDTLYIESATDSEGSKIKVMS